MQTTAERTGSALPRDEQGRYQGIPDRSHVPWVTPLPPEQVTAAELEELVALANSGDPKASARLCELYAEEHSVGTFRRQHFRALTKAIGSYAFWEHHKADAEFQSIEQIFMPEDPTPVERVIAEATAFAFCHHHLAQARAYDRQADFAREKSPEYDRALRNQTLTAARAAATFTRFLKETDLARHRKVQLENARVLLENNKVTLELNKLKLAAAKAAQEREGEACRASGIPATRERAHPPQGSNPGPEPEGVQGRKEAVALGSDSPGAPGPAELEPQRAEASAPAQGLSLTPNSRECKDATRLLHSDREREGEACRASGIPATRERAHPPQGSNPTPNTPAQTSRNTTCTTSVKKVPNPLFSSIRTRRPQAPVPEIKTGNSGRDLEFGDRELITPQAYGGV